MSLRARIEAVIYAAEEPVTLAQLVAVFREEALAAHDAASDRLAATGELPFDAAAAAEAHEREAPASTAALLEAIEHPEVVRASQPDGFVESPTPATGEEADANAMLEQKRLERIRDREARDYIRGVIGDLIAEYDSAERGIEIREIAGGYRVATRPEYHDAVRSFVKSLKPMMKLTLQALETLAVIAYKQPVTSPEISEIRGVDSGGVLASLISRKLVTTAGRKQVIGRPILYKTTKEFLLRFGLKDISELPSMEEFEKMAGELAETGIESEAQLDLPVGAGEASEREEFLMDGAEPEQADAAEVAALPERLEESEEEELRAHALAAIRVDDESSLGHDLPGVHRDTAGRLDIDSVAHKAPPDWDSDEGNY